MLFLSCLYQPATEILGEAPFMGREPLGMPASTERSWSGDPIQGPGTAPDETDFISILKQKGSAKHVPKHAPSLHFKCAYSQPLHWENSSSKV
eukprot:1159312-Pelagomonas_calceolata.AAC.3